MKKYFLSFFLIIAFAFYVMLTNQSSVDLGPTSGGNGPITANTTSASGASGNPPAEPVPVSTGTSTGTAGSGAGAGSGSGSGSGAKTGTNGSGSGTKQNGLYKDGTYQGPVADAFYGNVQVAAVIQNGKLSDVQVLQYPSDRSTSREINGQAMPMLVQEAVQAQSANINVISGATASSGAFVQSLTAALAQAKA